MSDQRCAKCVGVVTRLPRVGWTHVAVGTDYYVNLGKRCHDENGSILDTVAEPETPKETPHAT